MEMGRPPGLEFDPPHPRIPEEHPHAPCPFDQCTQMPLAYRARPRKRLWVRQRHHDAEVRPMIVDRMPEATASTSREASDGSPLHPLPRRCRHRNRFDSRYETRRYLAPENLEFRSPLPPPISLWNVLNCSTWNIIHASPPACRYETEINPLGGIRPPLPPRPRRLIR